MKSSWLKLVMWLSTANQNALFQYNIVTQRSNLIMTLAPDIRQMYQACVSIGRFTNDDVHSNTGFRWTINLLVYKVLAS